MSKKILSDKEIKKVIDNVKATMEIEGMKMPEEAENLGGKVLRGEITANKAIELIKAKYVI